MSRQPRIGARPRCPYPIAPGQHPQEPPGVPTYPCSWPVVPCNDPFPPLGRGLQAGRERVVDLATCSWHSRRSPGKRRTCLRHHGRTPRTRWLDADSTIRTKPPRTTQIVPLKRPREICSNRPRQFGKNTEPSEISDNGMTRAIVVFELGEGDSGMLSSPIVTCPIYPVRLSHKGEKPYANSSTEPGSFRITTNCYLFEAAILPQTIGNLRAVLSGLRLHSPCAAFHSLAA